VRSLFRHTCWKFAVAIGHIFTICVAVFYWYSNELSIEVGGALVIFAIAVDSARFTARRRDWNAVIASKPGSYIDRLTDYRVHYYLIGGICLLFVLLYFLFPSACPSRWNAWISNHFGVAVRRLDYIGGACNVPHGSVLLLARASFAVFSVLVIAQMSLAESFNTKKFLKNITLQTEETKPKIYYPYMVILSNLFLFVFMFSGSNTIFFDLDTHGYAATLLKPQRHVIGLLIFEFLVFLPVWFAGFILTFPSHLRNLNLP